MTPSPPVVRHPNIKMTSNSHQYDIRGRQPHRKTAPQKDRVKETGKDNVRVKQCNHTEKVCTV